MRQFLLLAVGLMALADVASAEGNHTALSGQGYQTCGRFVEARKEDPKGDSVFGYASWAMGFLSGNNVSTLYSEHKIRPLPDVDTVLVYLDKYCQANPLDKFWQGAKNLYLNIPEEDVGKPLGEKAR